MVLDLILQVLHLAGETRHDRGEPRDLVGCLGLRLVDVGARHRRVRPFLYRRLQLAKARLDLRRLAKTRCLSSLCRRRGDGRDKCGSRSGWRERGDLPGFRARNGRDGRRGGDRKRGPSRNRPIGRDGGVARWRRGRRDCRFRHNDRSADRRRGWVRRRGRRGWGRLQALERQDLLDLVSPGLMHLRPLASDIWLLPRRNRRQRGGRRHQLRRLIREHARLHHRLRMRPMRPIQNHDRRRRDPRHEDDCDRSLTRKERSPGFGRSRRCPCALDAHFRPVCARDRAGGRGDNRIRPCSCLSRACDRGRVGGRDDDRVCPCALIPPLAQSRFGFRLGLGAPSLRDRRRGFRFPWTGERDEPCESAFRTLAPMPRAARAILRLGDERRRRFSEHLVTTTLVPRTVVRTRLFRKPHGSLIDPDSLSAETRTFFLLG